MTREGGIKGSLIAAKKRFVDRTGQRYGRLLVIELVGEPGRGASRWKCLCDCGNIAVVAQGKLSSGHTKSCGCLQKEAASRSSTTHGKSKLREYTIWSAMLRRCRNPNDTRYADYGGRGISVCERWYSFENFFADMGRRPGRGWSIERNDTNGNYEPDNCRWATSTEQARNTRVNHILQWNGEKRCIAEWAEVTGIPAYVICLRMRRGWSDERALTAPIRKVSKKGGKS